MIRIVTDSLAYITREDARRLDVTVVPQNYSIAATPMQESFPGENGDYVSLLEKYGSTAKTSQPTIAAFMSAYNELLRQEGDQVLVITMSSRLSGTYSAACIAAGNAGPGRIMVMDSLGAAGSQYFLLERAREMADERMAMGDIVVALEKERERIKTVFSVDSLDALRRGGRISFLRMSIGTMLNIRPILVLKSGVITCQKTVHGNEAMMREFISMIPKHARRIFVMHISHDRVAGTLMNRIKAQFPSASVEYHANGPVLAVHLGVHAVGVAWME